jgi:hypothetical protein
MNIPSPESFAAAARVTPEPRRHREISASGAAIFCSEINKIADFASTIC